MSQGIVKNQEELVTLDRLECFSVIGDPGCDGLGAATMSIMAKALTAAANDDFAVIAGDIVPTGSRILYENVREFINQVATVPVYTLCGNHDTEFFDEFFGRRNYAIAGPEVLLIMLDNSRREFSVATLEFCRSVLERQEQSQVVIMFHIPPPNSQTGNSVSPEAWEKLRMVYLPHRRRIKYLVCGHVHSFFEDRIDGIPLVVTGGGGARIESVNRQIDEKSVANHVIRFVMDRRKKLSYEYFSLNEVVYDREAGDPLLKEYLDTAFTNECVAHFRYRLYAEDAERQGRPKLARLFRALSDSEYYHARNHYYVMGRQKPLDEYLADSIGRETFETETMYRDDTDYAQKHGHGLARYTFFDALEAEKVHLRLLREFHGREDEEVTVPSGYYTCSSCGYTFNTESPPKRCPVCGAPADKIFPVT